MSVMDELEQIEKKGKERIRQGELEDAKIKDDKKRKYIHRKQKEIKSFLENEKEELDEPAIYQYKYTKGDPLGRMWTETYRILLTKRQVEAMKIFGDQIPHVGNFDRIGRKSEKERAKLEIEKRKIEYIKQSDDPELDKKGIIYVKVPVEQDEKKEGYNITTMRIPVVTTLRRAMLCSKNFDPRDIGFKTYEEMEQERKEKEQKTVETNENKSKITLKSIGDAIRKVLGKGER